MESPVRIKIGVAFTLVLIISARVSHSYPSDLADKQTLAEGTKNEPDDATVSQIETSNNVVSSKTNFDLSIETDDKTSNITKPNDSNAKSSLNVPLTTTNRIFFRGTTKYFTTKEPFKLKIPHMRRNFTRLANSTSAEINTDATTQSNEIDSTNKIKELKLNNPSDKEQIPAINTNAEVIVAKQNQSAALLDPLLINTEETFSIDKYISDDFHDINNVYSHPISPEVEHFIVPDNESDYSSSNDPTQNTKSSSSPVTFTTPKADYFDRKFKEVSDSIIQNLADAEIEYSNDENPTTEEEKFNFDEVLTKPLNNNANLEYKNSAEIRLSNLSNNNNNHSNSERSNETKIVFESSTLANNHYDYVSKIENTPKTESENDETTTMSHRNPKTSFSDADDLNTEPSMDRRQNYYRSNYTRKEYLTTIRMRARTTVKPRIRISLKNNRNPPNNTQDSNSSTENLTPPNRSAEIVKMQPFSRSKNTLSTHPSKIDPVEVTASEAVESFVSSLSKRGSTKFTETYDKAGNTTGDSSSSFSIPPTATAWALIKFKDIGKRNVSTNITEEPLPHLDNSIKAESEEINVINPVSSLQASKVVTEIATHSTESQMITNKESNVETIPSSPQSGDASSSDIKTISSTSTTENNIESKTELYLTPSIITTPDSLKQATQMLTPSFENNEINSKLDNLTTPVFVEDTNTTSTVGTELNTESITKNLIDNVSSNSIAPSSENSSVENPTTNFSTAGTKITTTADSTAITNAHQIIKSDNSPSTISFIDDFSTTPSNENIETTEFHKYSKKLGEEDLDDFTFTTDTSKTHSPLEASGDEITYQSVSEDSPSTQNSATTEFDVLTQPTTVIAKLTTFKSEKSTTRFISTITTSLLPITEDVLDSREGKNKIASEDDEKNNEYDWIDSETTNDTKGIDSNEIPLPTINKTESDASEIDDNNTDNEVPKIVKNTSASPIPTTTQRTNIEVIEPGHNGVFDVNRETTTMFVEDIGQYDAVDGSGAIAAITISAIGIVALLLLIGILIVARGRRQGGGYGQRCTPVSLDSYSLDNVSVNGSSRRKGRNASKRSYGNPAYDEAGATSHPMQFAALANFALDQESVMNEFNEIPMIYGRTDEIPPGCESKNRFSNVIPLPETRVSLKVLPGDETSDYINANYVRGPKCLKKYYIACQAPMASTVNDFWRMIWEQNSRVILMLTEYMENGAEKCYEYIPPSEVSDSRRTFGDYQIIIKKRDIRDKYVISQLQLKNLANKTWREITHMWYFWPAKGVPDECHSTIAFLLEARSYLKATQNAKEYDEDGHDSLITHNGAYANNVDVMENEDETDLNIYNVQRGEKTNNGSSKTGTLTHSDGTKRGGPMVVHCSPGTGRTGAVIACDIGIRDFEMSRTVDVPKTVYRIRRDRANSVQTKDQYVFIYKVLSEYATKLTGGVLDSI